MNLDLDEIREQVPPSAEFAPSEGEYERIIGMIERKPESELRDELESLLSIDNPNARARMEIELLSSVLED